jgi:DNA-binding transcriptional LysR family regulator
LTQDGLDLASGVGAHVAAIRDATSALGRLRDEPYGTLRVTAPIDLGEHVLGPLLPGFLAQYPRLRVEVDISQRFVDMLNEGVDLAIRASGKPLASSSLRGRKIATMRAGFYASPGYLADHLQRGRALEHPEDLVDTPYVLFSASRGQARLLVEGPNGETEVTVSGRLGANDFHFVRAAVLAGAGVGALPWFLVDADVAAGRLVRVLSGCALQAASMYLLHAPTRPLPRKTEVLRDYLIEHAPRMLAEP